MDAETARKTALEHNIPTIDPRTLRAIAQYMTVVDDRRDDGFRTVFSESGSQYRVDLVGGRCACPDAEHNDTVCKHQRRAALEDGIPQKQSLHVALAETVLGFDDEIDALEAELQRLRAARRQYRRLIDQLNEFPDPAADEPATDGDDGGADSTVDPEGPLARAIARPISPGETTTGGHAAPSDD